MLEQLRAWANGKREYYAGVALLAEAGGAAPLLAVLKKGPTAFSIAKLQSELLAICNQLKAKQNENPTSISISGDKPGPIKDTEGGEAITNSTGANPQLYEATRQEALKVYKTAMNDRAILFSQVNALGAEEVNLPHHVASRASLAIAIVCNYNEASRLFDIADHVKQHGRLPDDIAQSPGQSEYDALPDDKVHTTLDNLRKAYSKLKAKEQTPKRVALMQQHKSNIEKLEVKWRLLKEK